MQPASEFEDFGADAEGEEPQKFVCPKTPQFACFAAVEFFASVDAVVRRLEVERAECDDEVLDALLRHGTRFAVGLRERYGRGSRGTVELCELLPCPACEYRFDIYEECLMVCCERLDYRTAYRLYTKLLAHFNTCSWENQMRKRLQPQPPQAMIPGQPRVGVPEPPREDEDLRCKVFHEKAHLSELLRDLLDVPESDRARDLQKKARVQFEDLLFKSFHRVMSVATERRDFRDQHSYLHGTRIDLIREIAKDPKTQLPTQVGEQVTEGLSEADKMLPDTDRLRKEYEHAQRPRDPAREDQIRKMKRKLKKLEGREDE